MHIHSLEDLWLHELKDLHSAEKQILKAMPKLVDAASAPELRRTLENHLQETSGHVERLENIMEILESKPDGTKCQGVEGLLAEARSTLDHVSSAAVRDAALIAELQKVEHYEICGYGTAVAYAEQLGETRAVGLLMKTLAEEKEADGWLNRMAEGQINPQAATEPVH